MKHRYWPVIGFGVVLLLWEVGTRIFRPNPLIFPTLGIVLRALWSNAFMLLREAAITMAEAVLGLCVGSVSGYGVALLFVVLPQSRAAFYPYAVALKATPLVALAPILVLWFGNGVLAKIVMSALVAFFPVLVSSVTGLTSVDPGAADLFRTLGATRGQTLVKLRIPSSLVHALSGVRVASSLAVVGAVIGEFTGSSYGIGRVITGASYYLDTGLMFAAVAVISLGGVSLFALVAILERKIAFWHRVE